MRRLLILAVVLSGMTGLAHAQSVWEGQVFRAEPGTLPETGLYAAANDFPRNTFLEVTLPRTGRTVLVEVLKRSVEGIEGPVLVLSAEAAERLGLGSGEIAPAVASVSATLRSLPSTLAQERRSNPDPEVNPAAVIDRPPSPVLEPVAPTRLPPVEPPSPSSEVSPVEPAWDDAPRTVSPRIPSGQIAREPGTERPEFVRTPGSGPAVTQPPPQAPSPVTPPPERPPVVQAPPPVDTERPRTSPRTPRAPVPRSLPLLAAQPPDRPRTSPQPQPPTIAEVHPDAPPAPSQPLERGPLAVGPAVRLPPADRIVVVPPEPRESAVVSPTMRRPLDSGVVILPSLPDAVRTVQPQMPPAGSEVADLPTLTEQPRVVTRHPPDFTERLVDLPSLTEQPRTVERIQPPLGEIADLPSLYEAPRRVQPVMPSEDSVVEVPHLEEAPRVVQPQVPTEPQAVELPRLEEAPRVAQEPRQPSPSPTPVVPPALQPTAQPGLATVPSTPAPTGRRYVSRPQKPEGDVVGDIAIVDRLQPGGFYVQLGSYRDEASLFTALDRVRTYVPLVIQQAGRSLRLLAGPVTEGQVGLLLRHYQSQGFRDAFVVRPAR